MRVRIVAAMVLHIIPQAATAQTVKLEKVQIIERGVYQAETIKRTVPPGTGTSNTVQNVRLINNTSSVLGVAGVRFGLRYVLLGNQPGKAEVKISITFPPIGLRNPFSRETVFQTEDLFTEPIATLYHEYQFEHDWEIVPGKWFFQFWDQSRKLAEQGFCVLDVKNQGTMSIAGSTCMQP